MPTAASPKGSELPFTGPEWKVPGYTGHMPGSQETYKKTPIAMQLECKQPDHDSFIYARTAISPKTSPKQDPCNRPEIYRKHEPEMVWPSLQSKAVQDPFRPPGCSVAMGDLRIDVFRTSYNHDFKAPFVQHEQLRSPNRNEDLAETTASLKDIYQSAYNRVGEERLRKIISTMRERIAAKMGNCNNNAFKFRKLFQMYDKSSKGKVHYEDFRNICETFGMQLDDDSLLALFYVYDPEGTGYLLYHSLAKELMDPDCYALYVNDTDVSHATAEKQMMSAHIQAMRSKVAPVLTDLAKVLKAFDTSNCGYLSKHDLLGGCAGVGLVMPEKELTNLAPALDMDAEGRINYPAFCKLLAA